MSNKDLQISDLQNKLYHLQQEKDAEKKNYIDIIKKLKEQNKTYAKYKKEIMIVQFLEEFCSISAKMYITLDFLSLNEKHVFYLIIKCKEYPSQVINIKITKQQYELFKNLGY